MKHFLLLLVALAAPAAADERHFFVSDFDRIRVEGAFEVHVATRGTPAARAVSPGPAGDAVEVRVEGRTLIVRAAPHETGAGANRPAAPVLYLRTTDLHGVSLVGGGKLDVAGQMRGARVDLDLSGSGSIAVPELDAEQLGVVVLGGGSVTLGGRVARARMLASGAASIAAQPLQTDELVLRLEGSASATANARYLASVTNAGLGAATVSGTAKCTIGHGSGPVQCGVAASAGLRED